MRLIAVDPEVDRARADQRRDADQGDVVLGDREGVYFIPPALVTEVLDKADETHIHDEWTKKKFAEGKYKSSEIYGSPKDPALQKEYEEYLKKRLEELRKK